MASRKASARRSAHAQAAKIVNVNLEAWRVTQPNVDSGELVQSALAKLVSTPKPVTANHYGITYELFGLKAVNKGFFGVVRKHRTTDIPDAGKVGEVGHPVELKAGEALLERNYFGFFPAHSILIWHKNSHAGVAGVFRAIVERLVEGRWSVDPVLTPDAMERMLKEDSQITSFAFSVAAPANVEFTPSHDFSEHAFALMKYAKHGSLSIRGKVEGGLPIASRKSLKKSIAEMFSKFKVTTAKVDFDDGVDHPIDLIADRMKTSIPVQSLTPKLVPSDFESAILRGYDELSPGIVKLFRNG